VITDIGFFLSVLANGRQWALGHFDHMKSMRLFFAYAKRILWRGRIISLGKFFGKQLQPKS
jgi:hypothetical protein